MYRPPNKVREIKSRKLRRTGHVARMEKGRSTFKILRLNLEEDTLGRPMHSWKVNICIDLKEIGANMRNCIDLAQDRDYFRALESTSLNLRVP